MTDIIIYEKCVQKSKECSIIVANIVKKVETGYKIYYCEFTGFLHKNQFAFSLNNYQIPIYYR